MYFEILRSWDGASWLMFSSLILSLTLQITMRFGMHSKEGFFFFLLSNMKTRQPTFLFSVKCEPLLRKYFELVDSWILFLYTSL